MKNLVLLAAMFAAFSAYGQSAVRRIDSLTNLLANVDPAAVGANGTVSYLVDGYYTSQDWGTSAREFRASTNAGTTNFANLLRSQKNSSFYWRAADAGSYKQDVRWWGAISGDGRDDTARVTAAINYTATPGTVYLPEGSGTYVFTNALPLRDSLTIDGDGWDSNLEFHHNGHGFQYLGLVPGGLPRIYYVRVTDIRMTTGAGYYPSNAFHLVDVSDSRFYNVNTTAGAGGGWLRAVDTFGNYDLSTNAIYGGNWRNTFKECRWYLRRGASIGFLGTGGPSSAGGPNDNVIEDCYINSEGVSTNGGYIGVYFANCNRFTVMNSGFEGYLTNGVWIGTNTQSANIVFNRFENQGGTSASRKLIQASEWTSQGHVIMGNMMLIQGAPGSLTRISPIDFPGHILDPSYEGGQQILGDLLVGEHPTQTALTFNPVATSRVIIGGTNVTDTNALVLGSFDGVVTPRLSLAQIGTNDNRITSGSSLATIPLSIYGNDLMAWIGPSGSGILGTNQPGNEFTVYGDATFGSDPFSPYISGWTTTPDLVAIRSAGTNQIGFWAGSIDGIDNRRVEVSVDPVADTATFQHTYSAGGGTTLHKVGNNTVFQLTDSLLTVNTNTTFIPGVTITAGNQVPQSRKEWPVDWVNVLDYGALINSTNDSTPAFQSAVDSGAAVVFVPNGYYALRSTLTITNDVRLLGDHQDTTRLLYYGTNYAIQIGGGTNFNSTGAQLENLFVIGWADFPYNGSYALSNALGLIRVSGATLGSIKNVRTSNARTGSGLLFDRRAYYFDVDNYRSFDTYAGINFQCVNPGVGDLVDTINIRKSLTGGCDWGVLIGDTNAPSGLLERGIATLRFEGGSIEGNRRGGMWINQAEVVDVSMYWEGNGNDATVGEGVNIRLGNQLDTNSWSVSAIKITGNRFATQTNSVQIYSANNVIIDGNDHQGIKVGGIPYKFETTNHFNVRIGANEYSRQNYTEQYAAGVDWLEGSQSSVIRYNNAPVRGAYRIENASGVFGDGVGSALVASRVHNADRFLMANSSNGPVEVSAHMIGQVNFPGVYMRTDGTEGVFGGRFDAGAMPLALEMNTTRYLTLDVAQSVHPNRFVIGETNGLDKLTVYGDGVFGDPSVYAGFTDLDSRVAVVSTNMAEQIGLFLFGADGVNNRRAYAKLDLSVPEYVTGVGYSSGGEIPYIIRSGTANDIATFLNSGVTIRNGAGLTLGGETITDLTGTGITIVGGALTATGTTYTNFWPDLTNALIAGANVSFTYDTGNETITINSSGGGGGATNGSSVSVGGTYLSELNLQSTVGILVNASGTNVEWTLADRDFGDITVTDSGETFSIDNGAISTNKIDSTFYAWVESQSGGGGGGDVYAASNNVFTGTNTFTGPITGGVFSVTTIILANPIGVTAVGTNVADAQDELQLTPGSYTMAYDLDLQQLATMTWTNGVMAYHNGSTITNIVSTTTGRSLLTASSATNGRDILEVGQLDQSAYGVAWDGVTNATPTLNALYDKIQSLPGGSNNISSWNTNYFSVTGGYLDWVGGSVSGGGGVTWIGSSGVGSFTNVSTSTNVVLGSWSISSNDIPAATGRYLAGESVFVLTNNSGGTINFHLTAKLNGVPIFSAQRSVTTTTAPEWHVGRFRLAREDGNAATWYWDAERYGSASQPDIGSGGSFSASSGGSIGITTNAAITWTTNVTLTLELGQISVSGITNTAAGSQRIAASLYNPGSGSSSGGSSTNTVFTVNGVTFNPAIITNSATVTWATNANGHIQATAAGGGGGAGTNIFVNNVLIQPAKLTNSATVTWSTNANGDIVATAPGGSVTNSAMVVGSAVWVANPNAGTGNEVSNLVVRGIVNSVAWNLNVGIPATYDEYNVTFTQNLGTNYSVAIIAEGQAAAIYPYCGIKSGTVTTNGFTMWRQKDADSPYMSDGERIRVTVFSDSLSSTNLIVSSLSVSNLSLNGVDLATTLSTKQPASAVLTNVSALTGGTSTNFLAGDGTFKQITTNMIPGLNAVVANVNLTSTPYDIAERYEQTFTPFTGSTTTTAGNPFTLAAINGGSTGTQPPTLGRSGLVKINSASTAYWSGGVAHSGAFSIGLTNVYSWKAEFHSACTNGVTQTIGFGDSTTTNAPTDGLFLAITNGTAYFSAYEGGTVTTAGTSFAIPTNTFIAAECRGTNEIAVITLTTNGVAAWSESINSANIPLGTSAVGVNVRAFVTSGAFTNAADLLILNYLGHEAATK